MTEKTTDSRSWSDVGDDELAFIITQNPDKGLRRKAKSEQKKRDRTQKVVTRHAEGGKANQMEIVAIRLTVADWFGVMFRVLPAIFVAIIILTFVVFMMNLALINQLLEAAMEEILNM
ncbi:hypothetical protein P3T73_02495 [Kiritimatiellota bacterium B12222]|nr:hypothetical protein P3T73_02495 [Kiritimatiellota bacterium B12222]